MADEVRTNSWSWRGSVVGAVRNARTALLVVVLLSLAVAVVGPEQTFTLYGRIATGQDVSADAGRLIFLGMGMVQAVGVALVTTVLSLLLRIAIPLLRTAWTRVAAGQGQEAAHV